MQQHRMSGVMRMYEKLKTLKDKLQKMKSNRANRQTGQTFHFSPFSRKQKQVLTWWCKESPVHDMDGVIADGAIRSGKTISMSLSFVMWAMSTFTGQNFAMCGKTIGSFRRNVLFWLKLMLRSRGYSITDHRADNLLTIRKDGKENYFYIFGGKDERSQDLIQGITLAGVFFDEVALMPESFVKKRGGETMGDTLHKMQVIIEATTEPLKKGMENSRREVKKSVEEIQKETEKIKNPFKGMESKALQPVRNTLNKIREMLSRNPVKNFQIKAGIKVPTEEYQQLNSTIQKTQTQLNKYYERRDKMSDLGVDQESMSWRTIMLSM